MEIGPNSVLDELTRGKELVSKLQADIESTSSSVDACRAVIEEMLSSLEKTIAMVTESSRSLAESPRNEGCGRGLGVVRKGREIICKKRSSQQKWTIKVRLGTGPGVEGPVDDGFQWRKYGQKDILAAKHPSKSQGCLATKQVQRSDDNPSAIDVTYKGTHTCRRQSAPQAVDAAPPHENQEDLLPSFPTGVKAATEGLDSKSPEPPASSSLSFSFGQVPTFPLSSAPPDDCFIGGASFSAAFISSAATSESNYFSVSPPRQMSSYGGQNLQPAAESDFAEIVSSAATNSSVLDMGFLFDSFNFDQDFPLDT